MSKGNMLLGHARGKVGDLVFSRSNGEQIVRARAAVVKNPQTKAQMIQRTIMNTVMQAYSRLQPICDHSFEGVAAGQRSMSRFMSRNLAILRERVASISSEEYDQIFAFTPVGQNNLSYNAYEIATGTLPSVAVGFANQNTVATVELPVNTYRGVIDQYGLQAGDQLTFCTIQPIGGDNNAFSFARVILSPANGDLDTPFVVDGAVNSPNALNEGSFAALTFADGSVNFRIEGNIIGAAGVIVSRQENGVWRRSNTRMVVTESAAGYSLEEALTLASDGIVLESEMYLNNANNGVNGSSSLTIEVDGGASLTVVGVEPVTDGGFTYLALKTASGIPWAIKSQSALPVDAYNKILVSKNAPIAQAWATRPEELELNLVRLYLGEDSEDQDTQIINWLIAKGVEPAVFGL